MTGLEEKIYTAIGQASMCWSETPKGVFDEKAANKIAKDLLEYINKNVSARSWVYVDPTIIPPGGVTKDGTSVEPTCN